MKKFLTIKNYLILANIILMVVLTFLNNLKILPFQNIGDFIFFVSIFFILALYRPGWSFLFFIGSMVLENINLAPREFGLNLRPYQFIGFLIIVAIAIRYFSKRLNFKLPKWSKVDLLLVIFVGSGFISSLFSVDKGLAFKQSVIILSFLLIYFLTRIFIQNLSDLKRIIPFFWSSFIVVFVYGIWQNWKFIHSGVSFEVMPGRPNATFFEPDWLGMYLVMALSSLYVLLFKFFERSFLFSSEQEQIPYFNRVVPKLFLDKHPTTLRIILIIDNFISKCKVKNVLIIIFLYISLTISYTLLILTVSRSAWLGAGVVSFIYLIICIWYFGIKEKLWRVVVNIFQTLAIASICSVVVIYAFGLTNFEIGKRLQSTGGRQEITVACKTKQIKQEVEQMNKNITAQELDDLNCRHINLEDVETEKKAGNFIVKVYRKDPNVHIRSEIYKKSWQEIKKHPIFGIGWGRISQILGKDNNGNGLNSSNIFLEIWLGSGIIGLVSFSLILIYIFLKGILGLFGNALYNYFGERILFLKAFEKKHLSENYIFRVWNLFLILSFLAILIPNLFNAGIMLGFLWVWLGISQIKI